MGAERGRHRPVRFDRRLPEPEQDRGLLRHRVRPHRLLRRHVRDVQQRGRCVLRPHRALRLQQERDRRCPGHRFRLRRGLQRERDSRFMRDRRGRSRSLHLLRQLRRLLGRADPQCQRLPVFPEQVRDQRPLRQLRREHGGAGAQRQRLPVFPEQVCGGVFLAPLGLTRRRIAMVRVAMCVVAALAGAARAQVRTENILPQSTDPAIDGWLGAHSVAFSPSIAHRNLLFLYLHGQGGSGTGASGLLKTAAEEGFHAVGLTYPNDWSPFNLCAGDPSCPENLRSEIIDGTDRTPVIAVSRANSIENRLIKLLAYLASAHPGEGWDQFTSGSVIAWDHTVVWGHSQGGGDAGGIARRHLLARPCFSAPAADGGPGNPAAWWATHLTPASLCYGFCHTQDSLSTRGAFWDALGMSAFGSLIDIATQSPAGTHEISTSIAPAVAGQYHNSVIADN